MVELAVYIILIAILLNSFDRNSKSGNKNSQLFNIWENLLTIHRKPGYRKPARMIKIK